MFSSGSHVLYLQGERKLYSRFPSNEPINNWTAFILNLLFTPAFPFHEIFHLTLRTWNDSLKNIYRSNN